MLNAFTVDVEDYYHVSGFAGKISPAKWGEYPSRVVENTHRILRILDNYSIRGTFYILGWVAHHFPKLVRDIDKSGHEIGSHSFWHRLVYDFTPEEFRKDLILSRDVLQEITGKRIRLYRAPSFSITRETLWALPILVEEGIEIDSSIYPIQHDRYGIPEGERFPYKLETSSGDLCEIPPSVYRLWKANLPIAGGGYFRLYPLFFTQYLWKRINRQERRPFIFYIHPWEMDPDQPRLRGPWKSRFRHYINLKRTESKLKGLLRNCPFGCMSQSLDYYLTNSYVSYDQMIRVDDHCSLSVKNLEHSPYKEFLHSLRDSKSFKE